MSKNTDRHKFILQKVDTDGFVNVQDLSNQLNVSEVTIRKDLKLLEDKNLLFRTHGGAIKTNPYTNDRPVAEKEKLNGPEKNKIAAEAAVRIDTNDSVIIASGTTMLALARAMQPNRHLTVVTAALPVALELLQHPQVDIVQLGGQMRNTSSSVTGNYAELMLDDMLCGVLFLGVDGIDPEIGLTTTNLSEARLNQKMINAAQTTIVLADSTKFGKRGLAKICSLDQINEIITDSGISPAMLNMLEEKGVKVTVV
ncbi:DeoR/GlpR family DNA-binding transcription regulator [Mucilaginibacter sp.]|uniref:DeoR/GlpR family DNA-binding transcription regulator n=1 Tax=Mucilaginibacter sp. TaxID=1882438 RepID=UPI002ED0EBCF